MEAKSLAPVETLPTELSDKIVGQVILSSVSCRMFLWDDFLLYQRAALSISLVSKAFYCSARPFLYRNHGLSYGITESIEIDQSHPMVNHRVIAQEKNILANPHLGILCRYMQIGIGREMVVLKNLTILKSCTNVRCLDFTSKQKFDPKESLKLVTDNMELIQRVSLRNPDLDFVSSFFSAFQELKHLKELEIPFLWMHKCKQNTTSQMLPFHAQGRVESLILGCSVGNLDIAQAVIQWPQRLSKLNIDLSDYGWDDWVEDTGNNMAAFSVVIRSVEQLISIHRWTLKSFTFTSHRTLNWQALNYKDFPKLEHLHLDLNPSVFIMAPSEACSYWTAPKLQVVTLSLYNLKLYADHQLWFREMLVLARQRRIALKTLEIDMVFSSPHKSHWERMIRTISAEIDDIDVVLVRTYGELRYYAHEVTDKEDDFVNLNNH